MLTTQFLSFVGAVFFMIEKRRAGEAFQCGAGDLISI